MMTRKQRAFTQLFVGLITTLGLVWVFAGSSAPNNNCDYIRYDLPTAKEEIENNFVANSRGCITPEVMRHILHRINKDQYSGGVRSELSYSFTAVKIDNYKSNDKDRHILVNVLLDLDK